ncbi:RICIN domain-containing protein [Streptomyces sp. NPDC059037]|uniref:RICIN domain-containing protein n=1 Tax=Streptomyces sp. NPDC059037 TaxID=3346710 RepID=UPI0036B0CB0D
MAGSLPEGVYLFRNDASGLYMELVDSDLGPNVPVVGAVASKLAGQQWEVAAFTGDEENPTVGDEYTIKSKLGDAYVGQRAARLFPPRLGSHDRPTPWHIEYVDEGTVRIRSRFDDVMDLAGGDTGRDILLVPWTGLNTQRWIPEEV